MTQRVIIAANSVNEENQPGRCGCLVAIQHSFATGTSDGLTAVPLSCRTITYAGPGSGTGSLPSYSMHDRTSAAVMSHSVQSGDTRSHMMSPIFLLLSSLTSSFLRNTLHYPDLWHCVIINYR